MTGNNDRRGRWIKIAVFAGVIAFGAAALAWGAFYWAMQALIEQPINTLADWIGRIEITDHGGDYTITLPEQ